MKKAIPIHKCKIKDNRIIFFCPDLLRSYLKSYEGKHLDVTFRLPSRKRTIDQNSRHWARISFAADILGDRTPEELHYDLCALLLTDHSTHPPRMRTSKDLTTKEFSQFEEDIDRTLAEVGIIIPEPDEDFEFE